MYIIPFAFHTTLTEDVIQEYECSDKIWVHMEKFEEILGNSRSGELIVLEVRSAYDCGLPIAVSIGGFHSFEDKEIVYAPNWIMEHLGLIEHCTNEDKTLCEILVKRIMPSFCSKMTIQPFKTILPSFDDPEKALQNALEKYTCIYGNSTINLIMPDKSILKCSLYECEPKREDEPLCIRDVEIIVNLLPAKDYVVPLPTSVLKHHKNDKDLADNHIVSHEYASNRQKKSFIPFSGKGYILGGKE
jgi:hypothetical protein